jgi:hypothetical protein
MSDDLSRRTFVAGTASAAVLAGLADFQFVNALPPVADETPRRMAAVAEDIEPLVRMIEDTPRDKLIEKAINSIKGGTSYGDLLTALYMAGVRGIQPRPVGFKFHAVLVVSSAHQASLAARDRERWLPLLWALDYFKSAQATNKDQGDWRLGPAETKLPAPETARKEFAAAMDNWDVEKADRAVTALTREESLGGAFSQLWFYGCRDFRAIGHKAIYAAGAFRVLNAVGWRHAEPVLRSLAYAMLAHEGTNPAKRDDIADSVGRNNLPRAKKLAKALHGKKGSAETSLALLAAMREAEPDAASKEVEKLLLAGTSPSVVWDGLFLTGGEWLMRQPGIVALHSLTSMNALHFIYNTSADPVMRAFVLLQAGAFAAFFRKAMAGRGKVADLKLDKLEKADASKGPVKEVLANLRKKRMLAAQQALSLDATQARELMAAARALVFAKGTDSHDYKFSSAVFEDYHAISPALRPRFLAASTFNLHGSGEADTGLYGKTKGAIS